MLEFTNDQSKNNQQHELILSFNYFLLNFTDFSWSKDW